MLSIQDSDAQWLGGLGVVFSGAGGTPRHHHNRRGKSRIAGRDGLKRLLDSVQRAVRGAWPSNCGHSTCRNALASTRQHWCRISPPRRFTCTTQCTTLAGVQPHACLSGEGVAQELQRAGWRPSLCGGMCVFAVHGHLSRPVMRVLQTFSQFGVVSCRLYMLRLELSTPLLPLRTKNFVRSAGC